VNGIPKNSNSGDDLQNLDSIDSLTAEPLKDSSLPEVNIALQSYGTGEVRLRKRKISNLFQAKKLEIVLWPKKSLRLL